jgi:RNA polymerase sigma factor (sigma-70 family)
MLVKAWFLRLNWKMEEVSLKRLFQQEFSKMVAVISKIFGLQYIEIAEDIVSETFLLATETWDTKGVPNNPTAWLYTVAKQKTLQHFRRNKIFEGKVIPAITNSQETYTEMADLDFSLQHIQDSQLQMLFAICTPAIASEAQIGLALRILCGFGIEEIAEAFLSNKDTINKRLFRAKEKLRTENVKMELPPENEITQRVDNVLHIIYLLFSEGYYSKTQNQILQKDLCLEALRLGLLLTAYEKTNLPKTNALMALMCFHASRFNARESNENTLILYDQQNEALWDTALINQGAHFLYLSAQGEEITSYHIEARIAYWHCQKEDTPEKWEDILQLYNDLLLINYSPSVALNRTFALYKARGPQVALIEAEKLKLDNNHFYYLLLGEISKHSNKALALVHFKKAYALAKTQTEQAGIQQKIDSLT